MEKKWLTVLKTTIKNGKYDIKVFSMGSVEWYLEIHYQENTQNI